MDWRVLFSSRILSRGKTYYNQHKVVNYKEEGNTIDAVVLGSTIYDVRITDPGKHDVNMRCTCPHARDGFYCKHMAAVMFRWEEEAGERKESQKTASRIEELIPRAKKGEEPFYHIAEIISGENILTKTCSEAEKFHKNGNIYLEGIERIRSYSRYVAESDDDAPAALTGYFDPELDGYGYPLEIRLSRKEIKSFNCGACGRSHDSYYYYYQHKRPLLCSHLLALLIEADDFTKKVDPGDYTDQRGQRFLNAYIKEKTANASVSANEGRGSVRLEPRLVRSGGSIELNFRIGNEDKMYVVKNLTDLHRTVEKREIMELGKKGSIDFSSEQFDESSQPLYELIEGEVRRMEMVEEKMQSRRTYYYGGTLEAGKGIPFTGAAVDTVYELLEGGSIDYKDNDGDGSGRLTLRDTDPTVKVSIGVIKGKGGGRYPLKAIEVKGSVPAVIDGVRSRYFISDGCLSRLNEDTWSRIRPFAEAAFGDNSFDFQIGHKQASRFYYDVLPRLREDPAFVIEELSKADGLIPEEAEFEFYLDAEDDVIICEADVAYGEITDRLKRLTLDDLPLDKHRDLNQERPVYEVLDDLFSGYDEAKRA